MQPLPHAAPTALLLRMAGMLFAAGLLGYAVFLWQHTVVVPAGSDASGYFNSARALSEGRFHSVPREMPRLPMREMPPYTYTPLGFVPDPERATLTPTYPIGLPLLFAGLSGLAGWQTGPFLVLLLHAAGSVLLVFLLARRSGLQNAEATLCAAAIAASPLFIMFSVQGMSDVPAMFWCGLALLGALQGGRRMAFVAGLAIGMAVLIRPTNLLLGLPVVLALGRDWRRWLLCGAGGVPAALFMGWYNLHAYGAVLTTGYGDVSTAFGWQWAGGSFKSYLRWLPVLLSPLLVFAAAAPWVQSGQRRKMLVHAVWVVVLGAFYSSYVHTQETWWYLRFILPAFPSLAILAVMGAGRLMNNAGPKLSIWAWGAALAVILVNGVSWCRHFNSHHAGFHERIYPVAAELIRAEAPANAVVLCMQVSGAFYFDTDYTLVRWEQVRDTWPRVKAAAAESGRPMYAALFAYEFEWGFFTHAPGNWKKVAEHDVFSLWRLEPEEP